MAVLKSIELRIILIELKIFFIQKICAVLCIWLRLKVNPNSIDSKS